MIPGRRCVGTGQQAKSGPNGIGHQCPVCGMLTIPYPNGRIRIHGPLPPPPPRADTCGWCGGPYTFDTTIDSETWNRVVRPLGISEYLCIGCILRIFTERGESFDAELWSTRIEPFNGLRISVRVEIQGDGTP